MPIMGKPKIYQIANETVKKSGNVFATVFMIAEFAAFLRKGIKKRAEVRSEKL
jgi:hypothetical protein